MHSVVTRATGSTAMDREDVDMTERGKEGALGRLLNDRAISYHSLVTLK